MSPDLDTGLTILGTAIGSAKLVEKLLGPTADYIGKGLSDWTQRRVGNISKVFSIAAQKLGDRIDNKGIVPPRVLKSMLDEASFAEDDLVVEYFAGVLASSRTEISRDDRGATLCALVGRLSTYQIRTHYLLYSAVKSLFDGVPRSVSPQSLSDLLEVFVPLESYRESMELSERESMSVVLEHSFAGLLRESLLGEGSCFGEQRFLQRSFAAAPSPGLLFRPTAHGVELFIWAHGRGDLSPAYFLDRSYEFASYVEVPMLKGSMRG